MPKEAAITTMKPMMIEVFLPSRSSIRPITGENKRAATSKEVMI